MGSVIFSAMPAAYAWQLYGWKLGAICFLVVAALMSAMEWTFILRRWSLRWLSGCRIGLVAMSMILIGLSAAEECNIEATDCHRILGSD